jgi:RNA polymerase sigma factor (sigma-70 family)
MIERLVMAMREILEKKPESWEKLDHLLNLYFTYLRYKVFTFCVWVNGEDILQEVKLKIFSALERLARIENPELLDEELERLARAVRRMPRQAISDQIRRQKGDISSKNISLDDQDLKMSEAFLLIKAQAEEKTLIHEITSKLTSQEQKILYLFSEGMTLTEIAVEIGMSRSHIQRVLKDILRKLVKKLVQRNN